MFVLKDPIISKQIAALIGKPKQCEIAQSIGDAECKAGKSQR